MDINININMLKYRHVFFGTSIAVMVLCLVLLVAKGLNLGMDFTGGTTLQISSTQSLELSEVRHVLEEQGFGDAQVQSFGTSSEAVIRIQPKEGENPEQLGHNLFGQLQQVLPDLSLQSIEFVGPEVGDELRDKSGLALLVALGMMLLYVWFRFSQKLGIASVFALFHTVLITLGFFAFFQWQFDLNVVAAVLALIGYCINDSIVISDYVRDEFRKSREPDPVKVANRAVCLTLGRTINTSSTTLVVVLALLFFGGQAIHGFAQAMTIGIVVGTYSSIYIVCHLALVMGMTRQDFILPEKQEVGDMP